MSVKSRKQIHIGAQVSADFDSAATLARTAERGLFDFVLADDPTVLAALAAVTSRIGLVAAVDTTGSAPFEVARQLATLDHLSGGRAGWRVGSGEDSEEFVTVVTKFWDSWAPGAVVADRAAGRYVDPDRVRAVRHRGPRFDVRGVATLPTRAQGHPVLVRGFSFDRGAGDGFIVASGRLEEFVDAEVPLLQGQGRFRTEYAGDTLRDHLGL